MENGSFSGVVVGRIVNVVPHSNADHLSVCEVDVGQNLPLQIVCGASNVRAGLKVAVALIGAVLPDNWKIKKSKLRGIESFGMLCSAQELGLSTASDGILELADDYEVGVDLVL